MEDFSKLESSLAKAREAALRKQSEEHAKGMPYGLIKDDDGGNVFHCPSEIIWQERSCYLGLAIAQACRLAGIPMVTSKLGEEPRTETYEDLGILCGLYSTNYLKLSRGKRGIELGKAELQALLVRSEFLVRETYLGPRMLRKDNYFFGNNPGEKDVNTKEEITFMIKQRFYSLFKIHSEISRLLYESFVKVMSHIGLDYISSQDQYVLALNAAMKPFSEAVEEFHRPIREKISKGKYKLIRWRRPKKPTSSKVLLPWELQLINKLLDPVWSNLMPIQKEWQEIDCLKDFNKLVETLDVIMAKRWSLLEAFGALTTKRLSTVKTKADRQVRKKVDVTQELLRSIYDSPIRGAEKFCDDLEEMFGSQFNRVVSRAFNCSYGPRKDYKDRLMYEIISLMRDNGLINEEVTHKKPIASGDTNWNEIDRLITASIKFMSYYDTISAVTNSMRKRETSGKVPNATRVRWLKDISIILEKIKLNNDYVQSTSDESIANAVRLVPELFKVMSLKEQGSELMRATTALRSHLHEIYTPEGSKRATPGAT